MGAPLNAYKIFYGYPMQLKSCGELTKRFYYYEGKLPINCTL